MERLIRIAVLSYALVLAPPPSFAQSPDIEAMKRSLEAQIGVFQRVNDLETRVSALEKKGGDQSAVVVDSGAIGPHHNQIAPEFAPTSHEAIQFALSMYRGVLPSHTFVDIGCGDGRVLIAAVQKFGCHGLGIEIDPDQAALARKCVEAAGLSGKIQIVEGDATKMRFPKVDAGFAFLYPETLDALTDKIAAIPAFVSYQHPVKGLKETRSALGKFYSKEPIVQQAETQVVAGRPYAVWNGMTYYQEYNPNCNCAMCQSIRGQLQIPRTQTVLAQVRQPVVQRAQSGHWQKQCINGVCQMVWVND